MIATRLRWFDLASTLLALSCSGTPVAPQPRAAADPTPSAAPSASASTRLASDADRCAKGDDQACVEHAASLEATSPDEATALYDRACSKDIASGCAGAARLLYRAKQLTPALAVYEQACRLTDARSCADAAAMHHFALGTARDYELAFKLYSQACAGDSGIGCAGQAGLLLTGEAGRLDRSAAGDLLAKACRLKYAPGCDGACQLKHASCNND